MQKGQGEQKNGGETKRRRTHNERWLSHCRTEKIKTGGNQEQEEKTICKCISLIKKREKVQGRSVREKSLIESQSAVQIAQSGHYRKRIDPADFIVVIEHTSDEQGYQ